MTCVTIFREIKFHTLNNNTLRKKPESMSKEFCFIIMNSNNKKYCNIGSNELKFKLTEKELL